MQDLKITGDPSRSLVKRIVREQLTTWRNSELIHMRNLHKALGALLSPLSVHDLPAVIRGLEIYAEYLKSYQVPSQISNAIFKEYEELTHTNFLTLYNKEKTNADKSNS